MQRCALYVQTSQQNGERSKQHRMPTFRVSSCMRITVWVLTLFLATPATTQPTTPPAAGIPNDPLPPFSPPSLPPPPTPAPVVIYITNETDLAQHITAAASPTILMLPSDLLLTMALPILQIPIQLHAVTNTSIRCSTSNFTALTANSSSFSMTGLTWSGCGTVMVLQQADSTGSIINISSCMFHQNTVDPAAVGTGRVQIRQETGKTGRRLSIFSEERECVWLLHSPTTRKRDGKLVFWRVCQIPVFCGNWCFCVAHAES